MKSETSCSRRFKKKVGKWLYDDGVEVRSTFRVCSNCGAVYHIFSGDSEFKRCPNCSVWMVIA